MPRKRECNYNLDHFKDWTEKKAGEEKIRQRQAGEFMALEYYFTRKNWV